MPAATFIFECNTATYLDCVQKTSSAQTFPGRSR
jgi:hypothetical protein